MERVRARELTDRYFTAWLDADIAAFLSCLHRKAVVRECTGAAFEGLEELERWFGEWNRGENRVTQWEVSSWGFDEGEESAFIEWEFRCLYEGTEYEWLGASVVHFRDERILELNEYERKRNGDRE